jgi:SAM-dependent methyltransferase
MNRLFSPAVLSVVIAFILPPDSLLSQPDSGEVHFLPRVGQQGKDVIWVPTPEELVKKMVELAEVGPADNLIDLGSGDGRIVLAAARLGAKATGVEYNQEMVRISRKKAEEEGLSGRASFVRADLFEYDLSEATVITMFLLPEINLKLRPRLLDLKPGTRILSNTFTMGTWEPDYEVSTESNWNSWHMAMMWIVPAKIEGKWRCDTGIIDFIQEFQMLYGTLTRNNETFKISEGRITGDRIEFIAGGCSYSARLSGNNKLEGSVACAGHRQVWLSERAEK